MSKIFKIFDIFGITRAALGEVTPSVPENLLLETGDALLAESGNNLILE